MNLKCSIDLLRMEQARIGHKDGRAYIVLPVDENDISVVSDQNSGQPKAAYLNFNVWENKSGAAGKYGHTHYIKQDFSKSYRESHSQEALKQKPFLGNAKPLELRQPVERAEIRNEYIVPVGTVTQPSDDLPF